MYDKIEDTENQLIAARAKKMAIEAEKLTGDNIYKVLIYFDKLYSVMDDQEKRQLMESLIAEIQIPNLCGRYEPEFGQRYTYEDGCLAFQGRGRLEKDSG